MKFNIGDRVYSLCNNLQFNPLINEGDTGTICGSHARGDDQIVYHICWDKDVGGHSCDGECEEGHGWNTFGDKIAPYSDEKYEPASKEQIEILLNPGEG